ncbi:cupin domain-containing protein [Streptomyces sp. URMC 127]|uniref:cupin domain-containing protein n=1 Tax=Streptomyces sp. URMC 127 TaxID=3423402 RepID=UPI003F1E2F52
MNVTVPGPVQVNFRELVFPPGAATGKHCHHGQLVAVVKSGTLTHYAPVYPGGVHVYRTGDSVVEGTGYVHEGRNEGSTPLVLWATYMTPQGKPLAETDLSKCGQGS